MRERAGVDHPILIVQTKTAGVAGLVVKAEVRKGVFADSAAE
jgi:hypothetical protein